MRQTYQLCNSSAKISNYLLATRFHLRTIRAKPQKATNNNNIYTQRVINPSKFTQQILIDGLIKENKLKNVKQILHPLYLYANKVLNFDYEYYMWACSILISQQRKLQIHDILTIMKLGRQYQIDHVLFWHHFQNQLLWRFKQTFGSQVQKEYESLQNKIDTSYKAFEKQSKDHFQILTAQQIQKQKQFEQQNQELPASKIEQDSKILLENIIKKLIQSSRRRSGKVSIDQFVEFSDLLVWHGSKKYSLLIEMIEYMTLKIKQLSTQNLVSYTKLLTHICTTYMSQYTQKKQQFTARSIKNIFKIQSFYYEALTPVLIERLQEFEQASFMELTKQLAMFPIKKRKFRSSLLPKIKNRMQEMQMQPQIIDQYIKSVCRKDKKMFESFKIISDQQPQAQKINLIQQS